MRPQRRNLLTLTLILGLLASGYVRGEDFNKGLPPPADTTPTYAPPPPPPAQDRKDGNGAAIAAAAIGAAMAGMSCAMMLKEAQAAEARGDSSQAAMMRMMGLQQCAQAAAQAASAAANNKGKDAMTQPQEAAQPKFADLPQGAKKETAAASTQATPEQKSEEKPDSPETADPATFAGLPENTFKAPPGTEPGPAGDQKFDPIGGGFVKLDPIDRASVQFDDSSKGGGKTIDTPIGASSGRVAAGTPTNLDAKGLGGLPEADGKADGKAGAHRGGISDPYGGGVDSGGSASPPSSGSSMDMASLMAQLQGKPAGADGGSSGSIPDIIRLDKKEPEGPSVNIFQYAGFRYRKAQRDDGLIANLRKKLTASAVAQPTAQTERAPASIPPAPRTTPAKLDKKKVLEKTQAQGLKKAAVLSKR